MADLVTADLHFTDNPRDKYRLKFLKRLPKIAKKYKCDRIIILGDLTEAKDRHSASLVNDIVDGLCKTRDVVDSVIILKGNHDYIESDNPFFRFLSEIQGIRYINVPTMVGDDMFLPHTREPEKDWGFISPGLTHTVFAHQTFKGAIGDNGSKLEGVPRSLLPPDVKIISGDVHVPQTLGNVTYVGAPYTIDFGDDYKPRILLRENGTRRSISLTGAQKRVVTYSDTAPHVPYEVFANDIVRVKVPLSPNDYENWSTIREDVRKKLTKQGLVVESVVPLVETKHIKKTAKSNVQSVDDKTILSEYCEKFQVDEPTAKEGEELL